MKLIAFTGGGTGGHVYPGLAVMDMLKCDGLKFAWLGSRKGIEYKIASSRELDFYHIPAGKLRRYFSLRNFTDIFLIAAAFFKSLVILKKIKPVCLFSKGGFVSVPPAAAARLLGIPVLSHESDLDPGLATRINSVFSSRLFLAYEKSRLYFRPSVLNKTTVSGNPVRKDVFSGSREEGLKLAGFDGSKPVVLFMGGSLGSAQINGIAEKILPGLLERVCVIHQTGESCEKPLQKKGYFSKAFFAGEYPDILACTDIAVTRAGAGTLWELGVKGLPAVLIPLDSGASRGDQLRNAAFFAENSAALLLPGKGPAEDEVLQLIFMLIEDTKLAARYSENIRKLCRPDAAACIAAELRTAAGLF
jgi:UDP-N-acetylglucosamine--N-acetylmuramyl-(pentapeptide) pyrophosphoryl-undecaprenol N-acetylglucosamine transferase